LEILLLLIAALLIWAIIIYNRLVRDRNRVRAAWSDIDVQLKRRYDLIPKLVSAVQAYGRFESSTLEHLTRLRSKGESTEAPGERGRVENEITAGVQKLIAVAEAYPELKTADQFLSLQRNLTEVENDIQFARRYYNGAVRNLNTRIESFPDLLPARLFRYLPAEYFELETVTEAEPQGVS
jgi:LemA protein